MPACISEFGEGESDPKWTPGHVVLGTGSIDSPKFMTSCNKMEMKNAISKIFFTHFSLK